MSLSSHGSGRIIVRLGVCEVIKGSYKWLVELVWAS